MARADRTGALRSLDTLYRFAGGLRSPGEIDIERPVQVVHDVAPAAERQAIVYIDGAFLVVTGGAGVNVFSERDEDDIRGLATAQLAERGLTSSNSLVWLVGYDATVTSATAADFSQISAGVELPIGQGGFAFTSAAQPFLIAFGNFANVSFSVVSGGEYFIRYQETGTLISLLNSNSELDLPIPISKFLARTQDDATGAITVRHKPIYAVAPLGVTPSAVRAS